MPYYPNSAPANLDTDGLRGFVEDELRNIMRAFAGNDVSISAITTNEAAIAANTAAIAKLTNNQLARVGLTTNQTGLGTAYTVVAFDTVAFDPSGIWDGTNKRLKPTVAGYYRVSYAASFALAGTGVAVNMGLFKSGSLVGVGCSFPNASASTNTWNMSGGDMVHVNGTTDYIDMRVSNSGSVRSIFGDATQTYMSINLVKAD
jgi:hypothetical protein